MSTDEYVQIPEDESVGPLNKPAPVKAQLGGGIDADGNLQPFLINGSGQLEVSSGGGGGTQDSNLIEVSGSPIALGQTTMADSLPVVIASNQSAVPISGIIQIEGATGGVITTTTTAGPVVSMDVNVTGGVVSGNFQPTGLTVEGIITMVTIDATTWYLAPPSPLLLRNNIQVQNPSTSTADILWNYSNSAASTAGIHIPPGGSYSVAIRGSIPVYIRAATAATITCPVEELE